MKTQKFAWENKNAGPADGALGSGKTPLQASFNYNENKALWTTATLTHEPTRNMDPGQHHTR